MHLAEEKIPRSYVIGCYELHGKQSGEKKIEYSFSKTTIAFTAKQSVELWLDNELSLSKGGLSA